jgi:hypothetical protein
MEAVLRTVLLSAARAAGPWTPARLGPSLYDLWDAERPGDLALNGAAVAAWASAGNGYAAAQATPAARPIYGATSFNGRPGVSFDGVDDELTFVGVGVLPIGATPGEIWVLADQTAPAADGLSRIGFSYGANSVSTQRSVRRVVAAGASRFQASIGDGSTARTVGGSAVEASGRHVVRLSVGPTVSSQEVDGVSEGAVSVVPATGNLRVRIGAGANTIVTNHFQGVLSLAAVTAPLSTAEAAQMLAYLKARGGIP